MNPLYTKGWWWHKRFAGLSSFSCDLTPTPPENGEVFGCEAPYGITGSKNVMLSEIARTLDEEISLKKTETKRYACRMEYLA